MRYPSLIFDFDGTIADTLSAAVDVYNQLADENGFRQVTNGELPRLRNLDVRGVLEDLNISKRKVPFLLARGRRLLKDNIASLALIDGMGEILPRLRRNAHYFGILTSNASENVEAFLETHGLRDLFTFISSTSKLSGKHKHLRSIARTFSLNPAEMLYIGDEIRDVRAAKKAGIAMAAVTWGFNSRDSLAAETPLHLVDSTEELVRVIIPPAHA
jgi:phosphoglycolate phosphatase-like HAD superfamily hydrolase